MVGENTGISGVSVLNLKQLGGYTDFLHHIIWSNVSGMVQFCNGSDSKSASGFVQISERLQSIPWQ
jgi:hypothetical protein